MRKIIVSIMILALLCSALSGCSSQAEVSTSQQEPSTEKIRIGVPLSNFADKSISYVRAGLEQSVKDYPNVELIIQDSKWDTNTQIALVENMISAGCKAIIMNPVESTACQPIVQACKDAGVYLIIFNKRMSPELQEQAYFIGPDTIQSGEAQGEGVVKALGGKGKVAMVYGKMGTENMVKRTQGFMNVAEKYPDIKIVAEDTANWKREDAIAVVENWIQAGNTFDAIVCNNDEMAIGAALAIKSQGLDPEDYIIAGLDGTPDSLEFMKEGLLDVTVYEDWEAIYKGSLEMALDLINGKSVEKEKISTSVTIMPEQVDEYIALWQPLVEASKKQK